MWWQSDRPRAQINHPELHPRRISPRRNVAASEHFGHQHTRHLSMCGECFDGSIRRGYREEQSGPARRPRSHYRLVGSAAPSTLLQATIWAVRRHAIVVHLVAAQTARLTDRPGLVDTGWFGLVADLVGGQPPTHSPDERRISEPTRSCTSRPRPFSGRGWLIASPCPPPGSLHGVASCPRQVCRR